ncbi:MAG: hypothetical protein WC308_01585 [archaeon]|jgi:hypothetical protein
MAARNHFRKDARTGRFAAGISPEKREAVVRSAQNYGVSLPKAAKRGGVDLSTALRLKGGRLSSRQIQRLVFDSVKYNVVKPIARKIGASGRNVTSREVIVEAKAAGLERGLSKGLVSKALDELAKEGIDIPRPKEYDVAMRLRGKREAAFAIIDSLIVRIRKANPGMRDAKIIEEINGLLPEEEKPLDYFAFRKRITVLKNSGRISQRKRAYGK